METDEHAKLRCRLFQPEDGEMVNGWRKARNYPVVPAAILPKLGVIVEQVPPGLDVDPIPLASAHLYMDNSTRVCWPELLTTAPGLVTGLAREAIKMALGFFEYRVRDDYDVMIARCSGPLAREAEKMGYKRLADEQIVLGKVISKERKS